MSQCLSLYMMMAIKYVFYISENLRHETLESFGDYGPKTYLNSQNLHISINQEVSS